MKRLAFGVFLALALVAALSAQPPSAPSISGLADTIHVDHVNGRTVFTGDVVIAIDGTEVATKTWRSTIQPPTPSSWRTGLSALG